MKGYGSTLFVAVVFSPSYLFYALVQKRRFLKPPVEKLSQPIKQMDGIYLVLFAVVSD